MLSETPSKQRFLIVAMLFIGIVVAYLDRVSVSILGADATFLEYMGIKGKSVQIGLMMSTFLAAYGLAGVFLSPLGDYLGPRKSMVICIVIWSISLIIGGLATSFAIFLIARIVLGVGEGWYYPMQSLYVKNWIPPKERGRANATWVIGQSLAPAMAMPLFAYVVGHFGWRASFWLCLALGFIPMYLFWFQSTDKPEHHRRVNAAELKHIQDGMRTEAHALAGTSPTLIERLKLFAGNYQYWLLVFWYISLQIVYWGLISWLPSYLKTAKGFTWTEMGWLASMPFVFAIFTKAFNGWINDKIGRSAPMLFFALFLGGLSIFGAATVEGKYPAAFCLILAFGFSTMATSSAWTLLQGLVPPTSLSTAAGIMNGFSLGLSSLSPVFIGAIIDATGSYEFGLFGLVAVCACASIASGILVAKRK